MSSSSVDLKIYAQKVFDAASHGLFDEINKISADFAERFKPLGIMDLRYLNALKEWSECMKQQYKTSVSDFEKVKSMKDCLGKMQPESLTGSAVEGASLEICHLEEIIKDFEFKIAPVHWGPPKP
jgi:hypothetical protein